MVIMQGQQRLQASSWYEARNTHLMGSQLARLLRVLSYGSFDLLVSGGCGQKICAQLRGIACTSLHSLMLFAVPVRWLLALTHEYTSC